MPIWPLAPFWTEQSKMWTDGKNGRVFDIVLEMSTPYKCLYFPLIFSLAAPKS